MAGQVQHVHELLSELETETIYSLDIQKKWRAPCRLKSAHCVGEKYTPAKLTNGGPQNDGLEKVTPFKHGNCWYRHVSFLFFFAIYYYRKYSQVTGYGGCEVLLPSAFAR